jgi:hypothetical protein
LYNRTDKDFDDTTIQLENEHQNTTTETEEKSIENKTVETKCANILMLICMSNKQELLLHPTTNILLNKKWKYLPWFIYYIYLLINLFFLIAYSIHIESYNNLNIPSTGFQIVFTKIVSYILLGLFIVLEYIQLMDSFINESILVYISSYKNIIEIVSFPLSIVSLSLPSGQLKSALFSLTILMNYNIFILRLDKFIGTIFFQYYVDKL